MVELPEGKMKSREGNVVDTDNLIEEVKNMCSDELIKRYEDKLSSEELNNRSEIIAMSAIRLFFLKFDPARNFVYNPKESLSFDGETGPYVEYSYARINSIFRKLKEKQEFDAEEYFKHIDYSLLKEGNEIAIVKTLDKFPSIVEEAANDCKPSSIARYILELSQEFNEFYHSNPILNLEDKDLMKARLFLIHNVKTVLKTGMNLLSISQVDEM
jgi:arginyl-tRNA synthetase